MNKAQAIETMIGGLNRTGGLQIKNAATARNVVLIFKAVWDFVVAERGLVESAKLLRNAFESMDSRITNAGLAAEVEDLLGPIRRHYLLGADPIFAAAVEAAAGYAAALETES